MTPPEIQLKEPPKTGIFAAIRSSVGSCGTDAPSSPSRCLPRAAYPVLLALSLLLALTAVPAQAATVTDRPLLFSFDGADATAGRFDPTDFGNGRGLSTIAVDNSSGAVYVSNDHSSPGGFVSKFHPDGTAWNFSATATSSLTGFSNLIGVAVDNSGGPNQGRLYASQYGNTRLNAFAPDGSHLCTSLVGLSGQLHDVAVDTAGHVWIVPDHGPNGGVQEYDSTACPMDGTLLGSFPLAGGANAIDLDAGGNVYLSTGAGIDKYVGGAFSSTLDPSGKNVYVNQSTTLPSPSLAGHIFTVHTGDFNEYSSAGALLGSFGAGYLGNGKTIAYSPTLDRVYVADAASSVVEVFGPVTTGTVPDPTYGSTTSIGISTAHFAGTVNPQSVANSYHFEWKKHSTSGWGAAETSPDASLPVDSNPHDVSFDATTLFGNTDYDVRLVAENTANKLRSFSSVDTFHTATAPAPPVLGTPTVPTIGTTTATVAGTIAAQGDSALWQLQTSTDPACATGFSAAGPQNAVHPPQEPNISQGLSGLLPSQHYCVRIVATNSAGTTTSAAAQFTTSAIPPDQVVTAFAAPRTDTSARLNAYVNPEGADLTYHFEYRADGVPTWTVRDPLVSSLDSRTQIVVSDEIPNLQPNTTYHYRFFASNAAGPASPQGSELTFTTRPTPANPPCPNAGVRAAQRSAYLPDCRGIELVNQPDKGNQNPVVFRLPQGKPFSAAGEDLLWTVKAGAPGSPTGTLGIFLSSRAPGGWGAQSVLPPADQLEGGGQVAYSAIAASSDFSRFLVEPANATAGALFRCDRSRQCPALVHFPKSDEADRIINGSEVDTSADLAHVVLIDNSTNPPQLKDFGAGTPAPILSIMPDGTSSACGMEGEGVSFVGGGPSGTGPAPIWRGGYHMIATTDASRVYFQAQPNKPAPNGNQCDTSAQFGLYVRNRDTATTTLIDPGTGTDLGFFSGSPHFIRAGADGRSAFFLTFSNLDPADANSDPDIYRWDEQAGPSGSHYTCLTCVVPDANVTAGGGITTTPILVSDDSSHIYFQSRSQLVPGRGVAGDLNLYVLSGGTIRFVADPRLGGSPTGALKSARISPDGNVLLLESDRPLTTDPVAPSCTSSAQAPHPCVELYRYDDTDAGLECLSCVHGATTSADVGNGTIGSNDVGFDLSGDGGTVAFTTTQALLPADVNATADIYEWHDGALGLITDGVTKFKAGSALPALVGVGDSGRDLFFTVDQPGLTGYEADLLANVYDARIGGGFTPPTPPAHCTEDSCQGPLQAAPADQPDTSTYSGPGNSNPVFAHKCRKGKLRRHGRCVKRHRHKHHRRHKRATHANQGRSK